MGGTCGVLVEFGLEKPETATADGFKELGLDICLHVAAANPMALDRDGIPANLVEDEKALFAKQVEGKPENIVENILKGKLNKFYEEVCLVNQPFIKDDDKTVEQLILEVISRLGENIVIKRFVRFDLGEE